MKEKKGNNDKKDNTEPKIKNNLKLEGNIQKIKTPIILSEKDLSLKDRDVILKTKYSGTLKSSAENFLVDLFEKISTINNYENVDLEVPISAAMAIITDTSWHQPTEAQIEYDFTRECIDKGIYTVGQLEDLDYDMDEDEDYIDESIAVHLEDLEDIESIDREDLDDSEENNDKGLDNSEK
jgi:hypothetical protein